MATITGQDTMQNTKVDQPSINFVNDKIRMLFC